MRYLKAKWMVAAAPLVAAVLGVAGCAMTAGTRVESYPGTQITPTSWLVKRNLQVDAAVTDRVNGLLRAQIDAVSASRKPLQFEYRFRWLNDQGIELEGGLTTWQSMFVAARDKIHMQGVAPNKDVTHYEFVVRFPDRI
jgi:uncharacterized protein YcfL